MFPTFVTPTIDDSCKLSLIISPTVFVSGLKVGVRVWLKQKYLFATVWKCTAVAPGTVGTVPTVPLFLAGTANRTTIWTENNNFEMKKGYSLLMSLQ